MEHSEEMTEAVTRGVLQNFANSQANTCARVSFLLKLQASGLRPQLY